MFNRKQSLGSVCLHSIKPVDPTPFEEGQELLSVGSISSNDFGAGLPPHSRCSVADVPESKQAGVDSVVLRCPFILRQVSSRKVNLQLCIGVSVRIGATAVHSTVSELQLVTRGSVAHEADFDYPFLKRGDRYDGSHGDGLRVWRICALNTGELGRSSY